MSLRPSAVHLDPAELDPLLVRELLVAEQGFGRELARLDPLGEVDLFLSGEERHPSDLLQVHADGIVGRRLHGHVDLATGALTLFVGVGGRRSGFFLFVLLEVFADVLVLDDLDAKLNQPLIDGVGFIRA